LYKDTCRYTEGTKQQSDCFVANPITGGAWTYHQLSHQLVIHSKERYVNQGETQYLRVLRRVLQEGQKVTSRNATVYSLFGERMIFDLEQGFPLLTTKRMGYKTILRELLWFIQGSTDNKLLQEKRVHIWDQNASKEFLQSRDLPYEEGDLGPIYGFQWRHSGAEYKGCHENYGGKGYDQLQEVIRLLRDDPHSRRIVMSAWNPTDLDKMALPPCHVLCQFYVDDDNRLDCQLYQRSGDMFLGVPFNIASYACLTHILAKITGYKPGKLIHILGDAHIYESHIHQVRTQIERVPVRFPNIVLQDSLQTIDTLEEEMISIEGYQSYPSIKGSMVA
jgi:thymidylate synthase